MNEPSTQSPNEPEREVRFAVVIYGGVSLAIYINGIVQELLRMVRSTSLPSNQLKYSETVYRKLACLVGVDEATDPDEWDRATTIYTKPTSQPRTKFVADIFSGTSAGGINAIFCGKALATGESLDQLASLWIEVADIGRLLNDKESIQKPLQRQRPPKSLLNAKWMYLQLLQALTDMDKDATQDAKPVVGDLDIFLTATDLDGLPLPLALPHQSVREERHRNVFHFVRRESGERDDFKHARDFSDSNNPFFAFAARCTSAFPFAFEPMALCDIFPIIQKLEEYEKFPYAKEDTEFWQNFYVDYVTNAEPGTTPFQFRAFGDGGYLDNKPFSFAIDTITDRTADVPVDRKLIYIEPDPEDIVQPKRQDADDRPDAIENSLDALIALPRYETIREDLLRLLDWNKNVARLKRVIASLQLPESGSDLNAYRDTLAYRAYQRLRHSATVDAMTARVDKALNIDPASALAVALRYLIDAWRPWDSQPEVLTEFLGAYDFDYMTRAAQYLRGRMRRGKNRADAQDLSGAKKKIRQCKEDPLTELKLTLTPELSSDLQSFAERVASLAARVDGIPEARKQLVEQLLDERWRGILDGADSLLRQHFATILAGSRLRDLLVKYGGIDRFDVRDSIVFPIIFGTKLGEFGEVDVIRISPKDATPLKGVTDTKKFSGIRGASFGAFGGFLDRRWRKHDILRGRLDGAERLITAILPGDSETVRSLREQFVIEAQKEIAEDWKENYAAL